MRWLSLILVGLFFSLVGFVGCGGANVKSAVCNECSGAQYTDSGCKGLGSNAGCEKSSLDTVMDDACAVGAAPTTHRICRFTNCDAQPACPNL